jgi:hypothetical protein
MNISDFIFWGESAPARRTADASLLAIAFAAPGAGQLERSRDGWRRRT